MLSSELQQLHPLAVTASTRQRKAASGMQQLQNPRSDRTLVLVGACRGKQARDAGASNRVLDALREQFVRSLSGCDFVLLLDKKKNNRHLLRASNVHLQVLLLH
jgi:3-deoxy-D-arabino-heptulosonate 7-phosphate (DAHP) synthase